MINIGIIGYGNIGKVHAANLASIRGCRISGIYDVRPEALEDAPGSLPRYASVGALFHDPGVHAIVIATPASSHRELAEAALAASKHIFVEKPLASTLADAQAIVDAASRSACCAQAGFCERFNPQYLEAKRAVASGVLGEIRAIQSSRVAPYSLGDPFWPLGILDTAVHNFDLIYWLLGQLPLTVYAQGVRVYDDALQAHSATTLLRFPDGSLATDHIAWLRDDRHPLHECARSGMRIIGTRGVMNIDLTSRPSSILTEDSFREIDSVIIGGPDYYGCLKLQFEGFLQSIEGHAPVLSPLSDALKVESIVLAAAESLRTGKEVNVA